jgi:hypothetical protein
VCTRAQGKAIQLPGMAIDLHAAASRMPICVGKLAAPDVQTKKIGYIFDFSGQKLRANSGSITPCDGTF